MAKGSPSEDDIVDRHLARAWGAFAPAPGLSAQVRARLTSSTAATMGAVGLGVAGQARPPGAWASLQASGKLGALVGAGLLGAGLLAGYLIRDARDTPPSLAISAASAPVVLAPPPERMLTSAPTLTSTPMSTPASDSDAVPPPSPRPPAAPLAPERSKPSAAARAAASTSTDERQLGELALLRRAERAVRVGNSALALALIGELEQGYPRSILLEERRAIELMAHCGAGATDARRRARSFLNEHPRSVYAGRVREMCREASEPSTAAR